MGCDGADVVGDPSCGHGEGDKTYHSPQKIIPATRAFTSGVVVNPDFARNLTIQNYSKCKLILKSDRRPESCMQYPFDPKMQSLCLLRRCIAL